MTRMHIIAGVSENEFGAETGALNAEYNVAEGSLTLIAEMDMPTMFVSLVGVPMLSATVTSTAQRMMLDLEVAMVLDNSSSMSQRYQGVSRMDNLKVAAECATNILLYDGVNDATCKKLDGAALKENVKIGIVPFALTVNVGTQFKNASWLDWAGTSSVAALNYDNDDNEETPFNGPVSRTWLFEETDSDWNGCVEARQDPYDTTDDAPDTPDKKFLPMFSPDTYTGLSNSYLYDTGGTCQVKNCIQKVVYNNCGNYGCAGPIVTSYKTQIGNTTANVGSSCIPASPTQLDSTWSGSNGTYTNTNTYSLLSPRELQERLCKYNNTNVSNSRTNSNCASTAILPLTNTPNSVITRIKQMSANGNTNIQQGTIWGVHMLTSSEPLTDALPRSDSVAKALIVMTDGENYPAWGNDMNGGAYFSWGFRKDNRLSDDPSDTNTHSKMAQAMDAKTLAACKTARDLGIRVYVVGLAVPSGLKDMLEECSSGAEYAFFPDTPSDLIDNFKQIAARLAPLRLAQ